MEPPYARPSDVGFRYPAIPVQDAKFPGRSRRNAANHYDLKDSLFDTFIDPWRQYSCAYFRSMDEPLADTQITKLARIAAKLRLQPHDKILDIGCGWGGMAFAIASVEPGASVTGISLS